ncbi:MAG TPA: hypothetical protein VI256_14460, partial [Roseiarcus sp.]
PSFQGGYFQRFGASDWLWGAKLSYNYLGATSTNNNSIIPQFGSFTTIANPTPVPFSGPAYVRAAQTSLLQEIDLIPFLVTLSVKATSTPEAVRRFRKPGHG